MVQKRLYAFLIAGDSNRRVLRFSISYPALAGLGLLCLLVVAASGLAFVHYSRMIVKVADYNDLLEQNNGFRSENQNYRVQTAQLGEKIDALETTSRKLAILTGGDGRDGLGGVGGYSKESFSKPLPLGAGTLSAIDRYNRSVSDLDDRFGRLKNHLLETAQVAAARPAFLPVKGYVTGGVGRREDPFNDTLVDYHTGIDVSAPHGARVQSPADGTVLFAGPRAGYGNIVIIDHKFGITTRYGHLWKFNVQVGQFVRRSDVIAYVGSTGRATGPHLHFELWVHNRSVDPLKFIAGARPTSRQSFGPAFY